LVTEVWVQLIGSIFNEPKDYPETSKSKYQPELHKIPEEHRSHCFVRSVINCRPNSKIYLAIRANKLKFKAKFAWPFRSKLQYVLSSTNSHEFHHGET